MLRPLELRNEISEDVLVVPRPGARLGMVLHGEDRELPVGHAFERAVVEIQVRDFELGTGERVRVDRESVVLRCDVDASAPKILDRLVASPVSELQFVRLPAEGKGQQLMAETDSEKRRTAHEVFRRLHRGRANLWMGRIPGTVDKMTPSGLCAR